MRYKKGDKGTITMKYLGENQRTPNDLCINQDMIDMEGEVHVIKSARQGTDFDRYYLEGGYMDMGRMVFRRDDCCD